MSDEKRIFQPKAEVEFHLKEKKLGDILKKSTEDVHKNLWSKVLDFDIDLSIFQGADTDFSMPLDQLKNKRLVYSIILHFLGRGIFCSKPVMQKFKRLLEKRLKEAVADIDQVQYKQQVAKLSKYTNKTAEEIMAPYNQLSIDFQNWTDEKITWEQYVSEVAFRDTVMEKVREKFSRYDIRDSTEFFTDFLANLQFDNFCFKSLKSAKSMSEPMFDSERSVEWVFPVDINIKVIQKREVFGFRRESVMAKGRKVDHYRLQMNNIDEELDPYTHGGHMRAIFDNEPLELDYYVKKHPGRQLIGEVGYLIFGPEVQKNPAALIYNMMILDLIDGDKVSQREVFYSGDPPHPKEKGSGGIAPYSIDGATTAARYLNIYYSYLFDHWYSFDITEGNEQRIIDTLMNPASEYNKSKEYQILFEEIMQREYDLINKWITFKKERDRKSRYLKTIHELYNYIYNKTVEFYESYKFDVKDVFPKTYPQ